MAASRKYPDELHERATWMAVEARRDPAAKTGALSRVAQQLGLNPEMWFLPNRGGLPCAASRLGAAVFS